MLGAVTLIAFLPGEGSVTTWFRETVGPWFGTLRWLLPFLLARHRLVHRVGPGQGAGVGLGPDPRRRRSSRTSGLLGAASVVEPATPARGAGGGLVGTFMADGLS